MEIATTKNYQDCIFNENQNTFFRKVTVLYKAGFNKILFCLSLELERNLLSFFVYDYLQKSFEKCKYIFSKSRNGDSVGYVCKQYHKRFLLMSI